MIHPVDQFTPPCEVLVYLLPCFGNHSLGKHGQTAAVLLRQVDPQAHLLHDGDGRGSDFRPDIGGITPREIKEFR